MRYANEFGFYELRPFPNNPSLVIACSKCVYEQFRGNGHGKEQAKQIRELAKSQGYTYMVSTIRADNEVQLAIGKKVSMYDELARFTNPMTGVDTVLMGTNLT